MATARDRNSFGNAFLQAFGAVDSARHRRDANALLADRLEDENKDRRANRKRAAQFDMERAEDRAIAKQDRKEVDHQKTRTREATAILSQGENATTASLKPYADIPAVAAFLQRRVTEQGDEEAARYLEEQVGLNSQNAATQQPGAQQPGAQLQGEALAAANLPNAPGGYQGEGPRPAVISQHAIERMAHEQGDEAAMAQRDAQGGPDFDGGRGRAPNSIAESIAEVPAFRKERNDQADLDKQLRTDAVGRWVAFPEINNISGDALRKLDPNILTAMYFEDRASIKAEKPQLADEIDKKMRPRVAQTIETQEAIVTNSDPASPEARNGRRKLQEAYGVADEIGVTYDPLRATGVDDRGLPVNGSNKAMTDQVIAQGYAAPGSPLPPNPDQARADIALVNRGTNSGRVNERLGKAAWRLMKINRITSAEYESIMQTGRRPVGMPELINHKPNEDLIARYADGRMEVIIPARVLDENLDSLRNTIGDDALKMLQQTAATIDSNTDSSRGSRSIQSFRAALANNEQRATALGYDLSNINDVSLLYQRWQGLHYVKSAYNDEQRFDGNLFPDFTTDWGTFSDALFNGDLDAAVQASDGEGGTRFGDDLGGKARSLQPLKQRNPQEIQVLLEAGIASSPEEAEQMLQAENL